MYLLHNPIREYAWGSRTAIAELLGKPTPSAAPQAELWMGAHPLAPSLVCDKEAGQPDKALDACIAGEPRRWLGDAVAARFAGELPFLFKVLACAEPLSLQAHPSASQALAGFAREQAAGIPLDAPQRTYKDARHKPELICALSPFRAWCGFRELAQTQELLRKLQCATLDAAAAALFTETTTTSAATALCEATRSLLTMPQPQCTQLVTEVAQACARHVEREPQSPFAQACAWVPELAQRYPHDAGVALTLLLNHVELTPGEALFLPAGTLHAYAEGVGVEIMANSDNVLRGGLTQKHIDVPELMRILDWQPSKPQPVIQHQVAPGLTRYDAGTAKEFALYRINTHNDDGDDAAATVQHDLAGAPAMVLVTQGQLTLTDQASRQRLSLNKGHCAYILPETRRLTLNCSGTAYLATTPRQPQ